MIREVQGLSLGYVHHCAIAEADGRYTACGGRDRRAGGGHSEAYRVMSCSADNSIGRALRNSEGIITGTTVNGIGAGSKLQDVVAAARANAIVTGATEDAVVTGATKDGVVSTVAHQQVIARAAVNYIISVAPKYAVSALAARQRVITSFTEYLVFALSAVDDIIARPTERSIITGTAIKRVVAPACWIIAGGGARNRTILAQRWESAQPRLSAYILLMFQAIVTRQPSFKLLPMAAAPSSSDRSGSPTYTASRSWWNENKIDPIDIAQTLWTQTRRRGMSVPTGSLAATATARTLNLLLRSPASSVSDARRTPITSGSRNRPPLAAASVTSSRSRSAGFTIAPCTGAETKPNAAEKSIRSISRKTLKMRGACVPPGKSKTVRRAKLPIAPTSASFPSPGEHDEPRYSSKRNYTRH